MDAADFDRLTRLVSMTRSRRELASVLGIVPLAAPGLIGAKLILHSPPPPTHKRIVP